MAKIYEFTIDSHHNIYTGSERTITYSIAIPENGIAQSTALLVMSYGYGGYYNSNIFLKLMNKLPDLYDIAVVNGTFFGSNYFKNDKITIDLSKLSKYDEQGYVLVEPDETLEDFNDMGLMQAMDTIYMTMDALEKMGSTEHPRNVIMFGSSHGGYIGHLANVLCPNLYNYLFDISAYTFPEYLPKVRVLTVDTSCLKMIIAMNFLIKRDPSIQPDHDLFNLKNWYRETTGTCKAIMFQGMHDQMVDYLEKQELADILGSNAEYVVFGPNDVDGNLIQNDEHSLGMNFEIMFDCFLGTILKAVPTAKHFLDGTHNMCNNKITVDYKKGKPTILDFKYQNK